MIHFPPADCGQTELFGEPHRLRLLSQAAHVVVVDDEPANVNLLTRVLRQAGFCSVTGLTDARELPAIIVRTPPDLVITDWHMPLLSGFEVLNILAPLVNQERLPVLVVTGDGSRDVRQLALTRGAKDFVTKPFDMTEVLLRVRNLLESRMLFQDLRKQNRTLLESASGRTRELESTRIEMIERLALAAEYRDEEPAITTCASACCRCASPWRSAGPMKTPACCVALRRCTTLARSAFRTRCCANRGR
jgi:DNA-binding response OmpR family regulator